MSTNVTQAVPFFGVTDMQVSLRFYVDGLGFSMKRQWIPDEDGDSPSGGKIRWCWLELGNAALMLQEFLPAKRPDGNLGVGASVCFQCEDALALLANSRNAVSAHGNVRLSATTCGLSRSPIETATGYSSKVQPMHRKKVSWKRRFR